MTITIRLPAPLRVLADGARDVEVEGATLGEALERLTSRHAALRAPLLDERGALRPFVSCFLNQEDVRALGGGAAALHQGDVVTIVPAIAGGAESSAEILSRLRREIREVLPDEVDAADGAAVVLDVREPDEVAEGFIRGARAIPRGFLELRIEKEVPDRRQPLIVYCAGGSRSLLAAESLRRLGYETVASLRGGFKAWKDAGRPFEVPDRSGAGDWFKLRYARHLSIPEVGEAGQRKLMSAKVLMIGAGGLGCPAAFYLAAAGVGTIGIVDFDVVDESNLQRQILHRTDRIGDPKVESARSTLRALNPHVKVVPFETRLGKDNVLEIFRGFDVIVDGCDNFATRYLVNDACVLLKKPNVHGSVFRFEGQATVFWAGKGPCYRCLFPAPPPPELAPSCAEAGVLGVLPGLIGTIEAVEALKILLGVGETLVGRLLTYDALAGGFREFKIRRDPECAYCGEGKEFPGLSEVDDVCGDAHR